MSAGRRLLLVGRDPAFAAVLGRLIAERADWALEVADFADAFQSIKAGTPPSLVLLDADSVADPLNAATLLTLVAPVTVAAASGSAAVRPAEKDAWRSAGLTHLLEKSGGAASTGWLRAGGEAPFTELLALAAAEEAA